MRAVQFGRLEGRLLVVRKRLEFRSFAYCRAMYVLYCVVCAREKLRAGMLTTRLPSLGDLLPELCQDAVCLVLVRSLMAILLHLHYNIVVCKISTAIRAII